MFENRNSVYFPNKAFTEKKKNVILHRFGEKLILVLMVGRVIFKDGCCQICAYIVCVCVCVWMHVYANISARVCV